MARKPRYSYGNEAHASLYKTRAWVQFRELIIAERGARCEDKDHHPGQPIGRLDLDHVKELQDGGAPFDRNNVMLRCRSCHVRKTQATKRERENREFWLERAKR